MRRTKRRRFGVVIAVALVGSVLGAGTAAGQTVVDCDSGGSLQSAIEAASPGSTIEFTGTCLENITIDRDLEIVGMGGATIDGSGGSNSSAVLIPASPVVTLRSLTITGGTGIDGGGIDSLGDLTIIDSILEGNNAGDSGGGVDAGGPLTIVDSIIRNNSAPAGGGIFATFNTELDGVEISNNSAVFEGGGVYNLGFLSLIDSTVTDNTSAEGGGLVNDGAISDGDAAMLIEDSTVSDNTSTSGIGGGIVNWNAAFLYVDNSTISGNDAGGGSGGGIHNAEGGLSGLGPGDAWVIFSLVSANIAGGGGGVYNEGGFLLVGGSTIQDHISSAGAAVHNTLDGSAAIFDSILTNNTAGTGGGAVFSDSGEVTIGGSTLHGNVAPGLAPGGGIFNTGSSTLDVAESTISNNTAGTGGGIFNDAIATVAGSTVVGNTATEPATGGGIYDGSGTTGIHHSILYGNTSATGPNCFGLVTSAGFNVVGDPSGCSFMTSDLTGVDPLLGPLADNGGLTPTHALLPGSPAIDHIPALECLSSFDQRGITRPRGAGCDAGAFEVDNIPDVVLLVEPNGRWHIREEGLPDRTFWFGTPGDIPLFGDWDGDGLDTPGMWRQGPGGGFAYLTDTLPGDGEVAVAEFDFFFGNPGDEVFSGDWDGDGIDTLGINRNGHIFLSDSNGSFGDPVPTDYDFFFGMSGDRAFGGDPDGDGKDSVFQYRGSTGLVYYTNDTPVGPGAVAATADEFFFGDPADSFVSGDWDGDQDDTAGIFRSSNTTVYLSNTNTSGGAPAPTDDSYQWGTAGWTPVAGVWE